MAQCASVHKTRPIDENKNSSVDEADSETLPKACIDEEVTSTTPPSGVSVDQSARRHSAPVADTTMSQETKRKNALMQSLITASQHLRSTAGSRVWNPNRNTNPNIQRNIWNSLDACSTSIVINSECKANSGHQQGPGGIIGEELHQPPGNNNKCHRSIRCSTHLFLAWSTTVGGPRKPYP